MRIDLDSETGSGGQSAARTVRLPFVQQPIGAGDLVKQLTSALGVKPCSPCEERARKMNERVQFIPMGWS